MNVVLLVAALIVAGILPSPRVRNARAWKATATPLASIMGSGFLVSAPLVVSEAGHAAPFAMAGLLAVAYGIGAVLRALIRMSTAQKDSGKHGAEHKAHRAHCDASADHRGTELQAARRLEQISHVVLAGAYVVSVSYYLQLLSAFVLDRFGVDDVTFSRMGTSAVLGVLTVVRTAWGLKALERMEGLAVSLNLGTIAALLLGLLLHDAGLWLDGSLKLPGLSPDPDPVHAGRVMMGLLIVVQGFETSRFLGAEHPAEERARTMRIAQLVASGIYLLFVTLMLPLLGPKLDADVTAIVSIVSPVATVLPTLIVVAAIGSQFSAATADDAGCAGLLSTIFGDKLSPRWAYALIGTSAIALTWLTDVLSVISLASRAFALFYALQCFSAVANALARPQLKHRRWVMVGGLLFGGMALAVTLFGIPAE